MAPAFVATRITYQPSATSAAHVVAITNPTLIAVGNYLILGITFGGLNTGAPTSITDPRGNTWRDTGVVADNGSNHGARIWYAKVGTAYLAGDSITVNLGANRIMTCSGSEYSGLQSDDTTIVDKIANAADTVGSDTAFDTGLTAATTVADELLFGDMAAGAVASTPTPEVLVPAWNAAGNAASTVTVRRVWTFYRIVAATGTYQFKGTLALAGIDSEGIATFKGAAAAGFDPATGAPWNLDEDEGFVQPQIWPDPTTDTRQALGPPGPAQIFNNTVPVNIPDEAPYAPIEDPSIQAWAVGPPRNAVQLAAWSREGEETIAVPTEDPTVPAWAVGPPQNAVRLQEFAVEGGEVVAVPGVDDTLPAWAVQPPAAAAAFDPASGFPWPVDGGEGFVQAQFWPDLTDESGGYVPPQLQAFTQPDEAIAAAAADDPTGQSYAIQPPAAAAFDPGAGFPWNQPDEAIAQPVVDDTIQPWALQPPLNATQLQAFNTPQEVVLEAGDDPTMPALAVPSYLPGFPFNADDSERFVDQQLSDDNVGYALGLVPLNATQATAFNTPQDAAEMPVEDPSRQAWAVPPQSIFAPPFNPATGFPFNADDSERFVDQRWSFLWADLVNGWGDRGAVPVYPIPPNPVTAPGLSPDPWFRRLPVPSGIAIEAWSLYVSLVGRYGLAEGRQVYERMLAERKGPFQAGAKYDPDRYGSRPVIPHIEIPKAKRN